MRVGLNLLYLIPGLVGGTETYARSLVNALVANDRHDYLLYLNGNVPSEDELCQFPHRVLEINAMSRPARLISEQTALPRMIEHDGVHVLHSFGYVTPVRLSAPKVVTIHDFNVRHVPMPTSKRFTLEYLINRSAHAADRVITVSAFAKSELCVELHLPDEKVCVVYNAAPADVAEIRRAEASPPFVLALSSSFRHKNIGRLLEAFELVARRLPDPRLVIAGHLVEDLRLPPALEGRVDLLGYVPRQRLLTLYAGACCFVMPSLYEGFGIPALEAMAAGVPVALSNAASLPEVGGAAAVYFDPLSVQGIAEVLLTLLSDPALRARLAQAGRLRAREFSWEAAAARLEDVYESLTKSRTASAASHGPASGDASRYGRA